MFFWFSTETLALSPLQAGNIADLPLNSNILRTVTVNITLIDNFS